MDSRKCGFGGPILEASYHISKEDSFLHILLPRILCLITEISTPVMMDSKSGLIQVAVCVQGGN